MRSSACAKARCDGNCDGAAGQLPLRADTTYVLPNGFRLRMEKQSGGSAWRLVGARPRGTLCHKPCTVSGGGKSEISKSIANVILEGPVFVGDFQHDVERVAEILKTDFAGIYKDRPLGPAHASADSESGADDGLGDSSFYAFARIYGRAQRLAAHAALHAFASCLFTVKRYYRPEWGDNWREHFAVDRVNGIPGHELKFDNQKLVNYYLRVGYDQDGSWRIYKLRPDFHPADKVQVEDDITASVVLPRESLSGLDEEFTDPSVKLVVNCETLLFQRPDDAIHRGADKQAEIGHRQPRHVPFKLRAVQRRAGGEDRRATWRNSTSSPSPMKQLLKSFVAQAPYCLRGFFGASAVGGWEAVEESALFAEAAGSGKSARNVSGGNRRAAGPAKFPRSSPVHFPVNAVLAGRRNSPPDPEIGLPPLAVYNPIHYQELPELFMEFVSSLTGKSPSTTGFGSEGALTKAPFNALWPVVDLNNALVSAILTGYAGFTTSAGYVGPQVRVDHDISMLVPEIWCRMRVHERDPKYMIAEGLLERVEDFELDGRKVLASRLGYRITRLFCRPFSGPAVRNARCGVHRGDAAAGKAGPGAVRRRRGRDRGGAAARGAELF